MRVSVSDCCTMLIVISHSWIVMGLCAVLVSEAESTSVMSLACPVTSLSLVMSREGLSSLYGIISIPILCDAFVPLLLSPLVRSECGSDVGVGREVLVWPCV